MRTENVTQVEECHTQGTQVWAGVAGRSAYRPLPAPGPLPSAPNFCSCQCHHALWRVGLCGPERKAWLKELCLFSPDIFLLFLSSPLCLRKLDDFSRFLCRERNGFKWSHCGNDPTWLCLSPACNSWCSRMCSDRFVRWRRCLIKQSRIFWVSWQSELLINRGSNHTILWQQVSGLRC